MSTVVFAILIGLLAVIIIIAILLVAGFWIFRRRDRLEKKRKGEEEQNLRGDADSKPRATPDAPEITVDEWQSTKASMERSAPKYGSTSGTKGGAKSSRKGPPTELSTKNSEPGLDSVSLATNNVTEPRASAIPEQSLMESPKANLSEKKKSSTPQVDSPPADSARKKSSPAAESVDAASPFSEEKTLTGKSNKSAASVNQRQSPEPEDFTKSPSSAKQKSMDKSAEREVNDLKNSSQSLSRSMSLKSN